MFEIFFCKILQNFRDVLLSFASNLEARVTEWNEYLSHVSLSLFLTHTNTHTHTHTGKKPHRKNARVRFVYKNGIKVISPASVSTTLKPGDCVTLNSNTSIPFVAKIIEAYETHDGHKMIKCQWYYRPDDLQPPSLRSSARMNELFLSNLTDNNYIGSVLGKVRVLKDPSTGDVVRGPFFCRSSYDPKSRSLKPFLQRSYMSSPNQGKKSSAASSKKNRRKKKSSRKPLPSSVSNKNASSSSSEEEEEDSKSSQQQQQQHSEPKIGPDHQVTNIPDLLPSASRRKDDSLQPIYKPVSSVLSLLPSTLSKVRERLCMKSTGELCVVVVVGLRAREVF